MRILDKSLVILMQPIWLFILLIAFGFVLLEQFCLCLGQFFIKKREQFRSCSDYLGDNLTHWGDVFTNMWVGNEEEKEEAS